MILSVIIFVLALASMIAAITICFSPGRAILAAASVGLSTGLTALGIFALNVQSMFWITPSFLVLDIVTLYFLFSTQLQHGESKQLAKSTKVKFAAIVFVSSLLFAIASWQLWVSSDAPATDAQSELVSLHQLLWENNLPLVFLCFLLLAPAAIGALLMVRQRD
jgi:NADH:ubiquinone oxidoreductase subunit 6 (subunit J)